MIKFSSLMPILDLFREKNAWSAGEISLRLGKSRVIVHKYLALMVETKMVEKIGTGPQTKYTKSEILNLQPQPKNIFDYKDTKILEQSFFKFSPSGEIWQGADGFANWCNQEGRNLDSEKKVKDFVKIYNHIENSKNEYGLLDISNDFEKNIMKNGEKSYLEKLFIADPYNYLEFGRSKLAEITFFAKDSQDINLLKTTIKLIISQLENLIKKEKIEAIAFTPPSKKRNYQILKLLEKTLQTSIPKIKLIKYSPSGIIIPQKTLKKTSERIQNARNTIFIELNQKVDYEKVLLIDDFIGSGATLNETAKKLKNFGAKKIIGFAWVGNSNLSYEVINEI